MRLLIAGILLALLITAPVATYETLRDTGGDVVRGARETAERDINCDRKQLVIIDLNNRRHRHVLDHAWDAIDAGHPERLTLDREGADENRDDSLDGIPTKSGYDRDEYPPAVSKQGGKGADVRYVKSSENRSAGSVMGSQLRDYCVGQRFRYERKP